MYIELYDYFLYFFYGLILFGVTKKVLQKRVTATEYKWFMASWGIKMVVCLAYAWIIVYYYGYGDPLSYYNLGAVLRNSILDDPGNFTYFFREATTFREVAASFTKNTDLYFSFEYYNEPNFVIHKLSCLISLFTFNRFLLISLVFTYLAFWGYVLIYKGLKKLFPDRPAVIALATFGIPSSIFWSSGITKEALCMLCLGLIFYYISLYLTNTRFGLKQIIITFAASYFLLTIKSYIFVSLVAGVILWLFYNSLEKLFRQQPILKVAFTFLLLMVIAVQSLILWNSIQLIMQENIGEIIAANSTTYKNIYNDQAGGSLIEIGDFDHSDAVSVLAFIPQGIVNVLFRPWPWEITNPLMVLTVLENLFFFFLFVRLLYHTRFFTRQTGMNKSFQVFAIVFSLSLALIIGISTFNFGTLVRYRIPFLPFWALFLLIKSRIATTPAETLVRKKVAQVSVSS